MKKYIALILALVMVLALTACGGGDTTSVEPAKSTHSLGDTVSTDIVDFTLEDATLSYYASALSTTYGKPLEKSDGGIFTASTGYTLVCMTFKIKNKDRGSLKVGGSFADWRLSFSIKGDKADIPVKGYDLNEKGGTSGLRLSDGAIAYNGSGNFEKCVTETAIMDAGSTMTVRVVGIAAYDPEDLKSPFDLTVNVLSSSGDNELFTYFIPAKQ